VHRRRLLAAVAVAVALLGAAGWALLRRPSPAHPDRRTPLTALRQKAPPIRPSVPGPTTCTSITAGVVSLSLTSAITDHLPRPTAYLSFSCSGWGTFQSPALRSRPFCPRGDLGACYPGDGAFRMEFSASRCSAGSLTMTLATTAGASLGRIVNANCAGDSPAFSWPDRPQGVTISVSSVPQVRWTFVLFEFADCRPCR
jgi:hypothetical protein